MPLVTSGKLSTPQSKEEQAKKAQSKKARATAEAPEGINSAEEISKEELEMEWKLRWGETGYVESDYKYLENAYENLASEYRGSMNPRLDMTIVDICKWRLERERCVKSGDVTGAKRYTEMIKTTMDSEAMKVGDSKQAEAFRVDTLADKLEKAGLLKDGVMTLKGVVDYIRTDSDRFDMSRDALDSMMLSMLNAYRFNQGMSELSDLEEELRVNDKLGEFIEDATHEEQRTMFELGMQIVKKEMSGL